MSKINFTKKKNHYIIFERRQRFDGYDFGKKRVLLDGLGWKVGPTEMNGRLGELWTTTTPIYCGIKSHNSKICPLLGQATEKNFNLSFSNPASIHSLQGCKL